MKREPAVLGHRIEADGTETPIPNNIDPLVYSSVTDWKPVTTDEFVRLLHFYHTQDKNLDDWLHGRNAHQARSLRGNTTTCTYYTRKEEGSAVSSPVLMTVNYSNGKVICFASIQYGELAEAEQKR